MSDAERSWWLDADRKWRRGTPPDGWHQASDGRWHPPDRGPDDTTEEEVAIAPAPPTQVLIAGPARTPLAVRDLPPWMKVAVAALSAVIVLSAAGVYVAASRDTDREPSGDEVSAPAAGLPTSTTATATPTTTSHVTPSESEPGAEPGTSVATTPSSTPTPTSLPAPDEPGPDPLAACSPGQVRQILNGTHPRDWYLEHFDENGDGVLCT